MVIYNKVILFNKDTAAAASVFQAEQSTLFKAQV